jgi:small-conductance mechanosensitive channel
VRQLGDEGKQARAVRIGLVLIAACCIPFTIAAQEEPGGPGQSAAAGGSELHPGSSTVEVAPAARDDEIRDRLLSVLKATDRFEDPVVRVDQGVVFLEGKARTLALKEWAGDLAHNTELTVAVVNDMEVVRPSVWNFDRAWSGLFALWRDFVGSFPFFVFAMLILALSVGAGLLATRGARVFFRRRIRSRLLIQVMSRGAGVLIFLGGVYIVLRISGLTQLAMTVVGGTGLVGLALGIAFRDITENFLASIFLSVQRPFETGDLVEIADVTGYVQQLNVRTTIVMNLDGNLVQIPNSIVYKSNVLNFTTNSNRREGFDVGIGYDDSVNEAQEVARSVLAAHPAVLDDPEPSVLVEGLGRATVNLRVYFWLDGRKHSWLKVRSSVIRLLKLAFQEHGISMPDEAREVIFPRGVPIIGAVDQPERGRDDEPKAQPAAARARPDCSAASTKAEAGLYSEAGVLEAQARQARQLHEGENLLTNELTEPPEKAQESVSADPSALR